MIIGNYLSSSFPIEDGLKHGDALLPPLFNSALEYAIRKVNETNLALDMNGTYQVLAYADNVNLIGDYIRTVERNADMLLNACNDIGLAVNTRKKYVEVKSHRAVVTNKSKSESPYILKRRLKEVYKY